MTAALVKVETGMTAGQNPFTESMMNRWLKFARVSPKSQVTYNVALKQMFKYFAANNITAPVRKDIVNWIDGLIEKKRSASTVNLYLTSCKLFFRWLADEGIYANICDHLKSGVTVSHEHKKDALSTKQGAELIQAVEGNDELAKRNRAIIALMLTAGLRTIEISRANVNDIAELNGRYYLYVQGKGRNEKAEKVLLAAQVYNLIKSYLASRNDTTADAPLFTSLSNRNSGARLSTQTISKMVKGYLRGIGLDSKRLTAHSLRHSAATQMILAGVDITKVQMVLRHKNINTTMIYNDAVERMKNTAEQTAADAFFAAM